MYDVFVLGSSSVGCCFGLTLGFQASMTIGRGTVLLVSKLKHSDLFLQYGVFCQCTVRTVADGGR